MSGPERSPLPPAAENAAGLPETTPDAGFDPAVDALRWATRDDQGAALISAVHLPPAARGLVVIAVAAGALDDDADGRLAEACAAHRLASLRVALLHPDEARFPDAPDDIPRLTRRLLAVLYRLRREADAGTVPSLSIGLHAAGAGSPAAIRCAAQRDADIAALVCDGGLPDRAGRQYLQLLRAPLLLRHAADDALAEAAALRARLLLTGNSRIDPLDDARDAGAADWFRRWLAPGTPAPNRL